MRARAYWSVGRKKSGENGALGTMEEMMRLKEGNIVAELGLIRPGAKRNSKFNNSNVRKAFNAAKRICQINQGVRPQRMIEKSLPVNDIDTLSNQSKNTSKGKMQAKPVLSNMSDMTHSTFRGQKMIQKALNMRESDDMIQQEEHVNDELGKLLDIDEFIKSYRKAKPKKNKNTNVKDIIGDEIRRFKLQQRKAARHNQMRKGWLKKNVRQDEEKEEVEEDTKSKLPCIFKPSDGSNENGSIHTPKITKGTNKGSFTIHKSNKIKVQKNRDGNQSKADLALTARTSSQVITPNVHLTPQKKTFLTKIDTGRNKQSLRSSFDLEKVEEEIKLMNLKVLNKINIRKGSLPSLNAMKKKPKLSQNLDLVEALKKRDPAR
ncbi:unnamed protein product [Moneuplotes crassus]|uniref:Uncharacterized protein n=1 Tax=Euplotes crassus TaxID=5936 RepID=A0AAD1UMP5_EUPCR|nr:unnamed protein product [Moneuplotes crassus]